MTRSAPSARIILPILAACAAACALFLVLSRDLPQYSAWKGWRILACPASISEAAVTDALDASGIDDYASYSNSRLKNPASKALPEALLTNVNQRRLSWFLHEGMRYFYLKDRTDLNMKVGRSLSAVGTGWILEGEGGFFPLLVILSFGAWSVMLFFSKNRRIGLSSLVSALLLPYSLNRWTGFAASLVIILASYIAAEYVPASRLRENPAKNLSRMLRAPYFIGSALLIIPLFFFVSSGSILRILIGVFFPPVLFVLDSEARSYLSLKAEARRAHPQFMPVRMVERETAPGTRTILKAAGLALLFAGAGFAALAVTVSQGGKSSGELSLPVPARYTGPGGFSAEAFDEFMGLRDEDCLPDLGDFITLRWSVDTFPWRRLQEPWAVPGRGAVASYTEYRIGPDGKITGTPKTMLTFDSAFIRHALSTESTPLEKMLQDQGRFVSAKMTRMSR